MDTLEKTISNLIPKQFPWFYEEEGPIFVLFVKSYFEWMETQDHVMYKTRRLFEYKDIDETTDEFLIHFKETYLKNIQLDTVTNIRQLIKHSLDLYRSKGSERGLRLLFQAAFGTTPKVYYPGDDIFKLSDGEWVIPTYLEISLGENNHNLVNKQIKGTISGATAFVEAVVRQSGSKMSDILYISSLNGNFQTGEQLVLSFDILEAEFRPVVIGSLTDIEVSVEGIGDGFSVGDVVDNITSQYGFGAKARVSKVSTTTGVVSLNLLNGGYGYSTDANVFISENILTVENVSSLPIVFDSITQKLATFPYVNANNTFNKNDTITTYYPNNAIKGTGRILVIDAVNATSGNLFLEILTGDMNSNAIYGDSNTKSANLNLLVGYVDETATANILAVNTSSGIKLAVFNESKQFFINVHYSTTSNTTGIITSISSGAGVNLNYSNNFIYTETVALNTDVLAPYMNVKLNATSYGFPGNTSANISTPIKDYMTVANLVFGKIQFITGLNQGHDYNEKPVIKIIDPHSDPLQRQDIIINFGNSTTSFSVGEIVTQQSSNARGLIKAVYPANGTMYLENLRVLPENDFVITTDANSTIIGDVSDAVANCLIVATDFSSNIVGENALIDINLNTLDGAITEFQILDSGFNYQDGEDLSIAVGNNLIGTGYARLKKQGIGTGYYRKKGGFLSDQKKLFDGYYYQNFSYDIISSVALERYTSLLKNVVHQAGKIFFGTFAHQAKINTNINNISTKISKV